jgi:hypothetical protein
LVIIGVDAKIILKWVINKVGKMLTGSMLLRIGVGGALLWTRWRSFKFHKSGIVSWLAEGLSASENNDSM